MSITTEHGGFFGALSFMVVAFSALICLGGIRFSMGENMLETAQDGFAQELVPTDDDSCKASAFKNGSYSYLVVRKEVTWSGALHWCLSHNGKLADVKTRTDMNFLINLVRPINYKEKSFWLGATNHGENSAYIWVSTDHSKIDTSLFSKSPNQTNEGCTSNCIGIKVVKNIEGLVTYKCFGLRYFICRFENE